MGDLIDAGIDRGMQWDQSNLTDQLSGLKDVLSHHKVLGYVLGNHELRIKKKIGLNPYQMLLGNETIEYGLEGRKIVVDHGTRVVQNPVAQLKDFANANDTANVIALGHDHTLGIFTYQGHGIVQYLVRTGHLMNGYADYARRAGMYPKPAGYIKYKPKSNRLEVVLK